MSKISVIIPVYNKWELTSACLRSLAEHSPLDSLEVILVDNASTDATVTEAPALGHTLFGDRFRCLRMDTNRNFGPACNAGAKAAAHDLVFFLNNDTLLTPGWLPPLPAALEQPNTAGVGPLLLYEDNTVQHLGVGIEPGGCVCHLYRRLPAEHALARKRRTFPVITGAALLLPKAAFFSVGGFHEGFINGYEDVDLCFQFASRGEVMRVEPDSRVYHLDSRTLGRHDSDMHNSHLLRSRWDIAKFSNLEEIAREDGYELKVDLTLGLLLTPARHRLPELFKRARENIRSNPAAVWDLLQEEPYWEEGYVLLAQYLIQNGAQEQAFAVLLNCVLVVASLSSQERLLELGRKMNAAGKASYKLDDLEHAFRLNQQLILDKERYAAKQKSLHAELHHKGHTELAAQYREAAAQASILRERWSIVTPQGA